MFLTTESDFVISLFDFFFFSIQHLVYLYSMHPNGLPVSRSALCRLSPKMFFTGNRNEMLALVYLLELMYFTL